MKKYDFDELIDRNGTDSVKYDALSRYFGKGGIIPAWVADADFKTPDFIMAAIRERLDHEILGYTFRNESIPDSVVKWVKRHHQWDIEKEWILFTPGVVSALSVAVMTCTAPGEKVIVQPPVYFPFFECIRGQGRTLVENPLQVSGSRLCFDLHDLEEKTVEGCRMLMFCSPHNPGGMVWKRDELEAIADICARKNILVVSDEIHADLLFQGQKHIPWAMVSEQAARNSIVCMAPSKTFNIAGLATSFVVIPDPELRKSFRKSIQVLHLDSGNIPGMVALRAAYNHGDEWLQQMMEYVGENYNFLETFLRTFLPKIKPIRPEATFLVWLDFSEFGLNDTQLTDLLVGKAGVALNNGARFGTGGEGFQRINIGCPRKILKEVLDRIYEAFAPL
jgi:cystathionine beta-lyase